jgi:hypothetical protein
LTAGTQAVQDSENWGFEHVRVKSYNEAVRLARIAGEDAANRRMRKAGRKSWSDADFDHAASVTNTLLADFGFEIDGWINLAGLRRNEPDEPIPPRRPARRRRARVPVQEPAQLSFAFA